MINEFRGKYRFLSNFYPKRMSYKGMIFETSEHAFQAEKAKNVIDREWIRDASTPREAKRRGRKVKTWNDWDDVKVKIMQDVIKTKFENRYLTNLLLATTDEELVEGNTWNDTFWGTCRGKGTNHLGVLLMALREELRSRHEEVS